MHNVAGPPHSRRPAAVRWLQPDAGVRADRRRRRARPGHGRGGRSRPRDWSSPATHSAPRAPALPGAPSAQGPRRRRPTRPLLAPLPLSHRHPHSPRHTGPLGAPAPASAHRRPPPTDGTPMTRGVPRPRYGGTAPGPAPLDHPAASRAGDHRRRRGPVVPGQVVGAAHGVCAFLGPPAGLAGLPVT